MDSESMSRSSTKDFSTVTSSAATPATSSTISASPFWMSSLLTENPFLHALDGWNGCPVPPEHCWGPTSRAPDDLPRVGQARTEAHEQHHVPAGDLACRPHVVERHRDRGG